MSESTGRINLDASGLLKELDIIMKKSQVLEGAFGLEKAERGINKASGAAEKYNLKIQALGVGMRKAGEEGAALVAKLTDGDVTDTFLVGMNKQMEIAERNLKKMQTARDKMMDSVAAPGHSKADEKERVKNAKADAALLRGIRKADAKQEARDAKVRAKAAVANAKDLAAKLSTANEELAANLKAQRLQLAQDEIKAAKSRLTRLKNEQKAALASIGSHQDSVAALAARTRKADVKAGGKGGNAEFHKKNVAAAREKHKRDLNYIKSLRDQGQISRVQDAIKSRKAGARLNKALEAQRISSVRDSTQITAAMVRQALNEDQQAHMRASRRTGQIAYQEAMASQKRIFAAKAALRSGDIDKGTATAILVEETRIRKAIKVRALKELAQLEALAEKRRGDVRILRDKAVEQTIQDNRRRAAKGLKPIERPMPGVDPSRAKPVVGDGERKGDNTDAEIDKKFAKRIAKAEAAFKRNHALQQKASARILQIQRDQADESTRISAQAYKKRLSEAKKGLSKLQAAGKAREGQLGGLYKGKQQLGSMRSEIKQWEVESRNARAFAQNMASEIEADGRRYGVSIGTSISRGLERSVKEAEDELAASIRRNEALLHKSKTRQQTFSGDLRDANAIGRGNKQRGQGRGDRGYQEEDWAKRQMATMRPKGIMDNLAMPDLGPHLKQVRKLRDGMIKMGSRGVKAINKMSFGYWKFSQAGEQALRVIQGIGSAALEGEGIRNVGIAFEHVSKKSGISLQRLQEATDGAIGKTQLMKLANFGVESKLSGEAIESFAKKARGAAMINGRTIDENFRRLVQGTAKQEREVLDELGIIVKNATQIWSEAAKRLGKNVKDLTPIEKTRAYTAAVMEAGSHLDVLADKHKGLNKVASAQAAMGDALNDTKVAFANIAQETGLFDTMADGMARVTGLLETDAAKGVILDVLNGLGVVIESLMEPVAQLAVLIGPTLGIALKYTGGMISGLSKVLIPVSWLLLKLAQVSIMPVLLGIGLMTKGLGYLISIFTDVGTGIEQMGDSMIEAANSLYDDFNPAANEAAAELQNLHQKAEMMPGTVDAASAALTDLAGSLITVSDHAGQAAKKLALAAAAAEASAARFRNAKKIIDGTATEQADLTAGGAGDIAHSRKALATREAQLKQLLDVAQTRKSDQTRIWNKDDYKVRIKSANHEAAVQAGLKIDVEKTKALNSASHVIFVADNAAMQKQIKHQIKLVQDQRALLKKKTVAMYDMNNITGVADKMLAGQKAKKVAFQNQHGDKMSTDNIMEGMAISNPMAGMTAVQDLTPDDVTSNATITAMADQLSTGESKKHERGKIRANLKQIDHNIAENQKIIDDYAEKRATWEAEGAEAKARHTMGEGSTSAKGKEIVALKIEKFKDAEATVQLQNDILMELHRKMEYNLKGSGRKGRKKKPKMILAKLIDEAASDMKELEASLKAQDPVDFGFMKDVSERQGEIIIEGHKENILARAEQLKTMQDKYLDGSRDYREAMANASSPKEFDDIKESYKKFQEIFKSISQWAPDKSHVRAADNSGKMTIKAYADQNKHLKKIQEQAKQLAQETKNTQREMDKMEGLRMRKEAFDKRGLHLYGETNLEVAKQKTPQWMLEESMDEAYFAKLGELEDRKYDIMREAAAKRATIEEEFAKGDRGSGAEGIRAKGLGAVSVWKKKKEGQIDKEGADFKDEVAMQKTREFMAKQKEIVDGFYTESVGNVFEGIGTGFGEEFVRSLNDVHRRSKEWADVMGELFGNLFMGIGQSISELAAAEILLYTGNPIAAGIAGAALSGFAATLGGLFTRETKDNEVAKFAREELKRNKEKKEEQYSVTIIHQGLAMNQQLVREFGSLLEAGKRAGVRGY